MTDPTLEQLEKLQDEQERLAILEEDLNRKNFQKSELFEYVMKIVEEEIAKANSNTAIPTDISVEERGQYSLAMVIAYERLVKIKRRLEENVEL